MDNQWSYQTSRFDAGTFVITAIALLVFIIMVVCFLRAFIRFLQNHYVSSKYYLLIDIKFIRANCKLT